MLSQARTNVLVFQDEISKDSATHGVMVVPIISGSDKTTASVGTSQQEYHPVYVSVGNISNTAWQSHGIGVLPVAFLPIPKGKWSYLRMMRT